MRYRWILRGLLKKADPYILFGPSPTKTSISSELLATQQKRTVEEALTFLRQWIKDSQVMSKSIVWFRYFRFTHSFFFFFFFFTENN
jgi:hypothetical protein